MRLQKEGKLVRTKHLSVRAVASPPARMRVGVIVPRFGQTAVARNRLKRRLRQGVFGTLLPPERQEVIQIFASAQDEMDRLRQRLNEEEQHHAGAVPSASDS